MQRLQLVTGGVEVDLDAPLLADDDDAQVSSSGASGALQLLVDYSMGTRPRGVVMNLLGVDDYGVLLDLMNSAGLPHPLLPLKTRNAMTASMLAVVGASA